MKKRASFVIAVLLFSGCGSSSVEPAGNPPVPAEPAFVNNPRIVYSDGLHSENTEMLRLGDRILLVFRGGEEGQTGSARARIMIFESRDDGRSFVPLSEVSMPNDPDDPDDDRDIRDPKLVRMGDRLLLFCISRKPGFSYRDLFGEAWLVRAESADGGRTWTDPVRSFQDIGPFGTEVFWGFWRFTRRTYRADGQTRETLYATAYNDGDIAVGLFASEDGVHWRKHATIISNYNDVPSEAELNFFGDNSEKAVSLVRLDNQGILEDGQTVVCTSREPFLRWTCNRRFEQRFDGPSWIVDQSGGRTRHFVFARKHLPCTYKRTAAYELRGDLTDAGAPIQVCEIQELPSSGDTAYTAFAPLGGDRYLLSWYSSPVDLEPAWLEGQFSPSDIWLADLDLSLAPDTCTAPEPEAPCRPPPLPVGAGPLAASGRFLTTLSPVIWPAQSLFFLAEATLKGPQFDLSLQPLEPEGKQPVGDPWVKRGLAMAADGSFTADFGTRTLPSEAYPVLDSPIPLNLKKFKLEARTTSADSFCGSVTGFAEVLPSRSDRIHLDGSTFGAVPILGSTLPDSVGACP